MLLSLDGRGLGVVNGSHPHLSLSRKGREPAAYCCRELLGGRPQKCLKNLIGASLDACAVGNSRYLTRSSFTAFAVEVVWLLGGAAPPESKRVTRHRPLTGCRGSEETMPPVEPTLAALSNPLLRYFLAARRRSSRYLGCRADRHRNRVLRRVRRDVAGDHYVAFALVAHAGINVLNDYYDALNGTDRLTPSAYFRTGGSRFIQSSVLTLRQTAVFGVLLVLAVCCRPLACPFQAPACDDRRTGMFIGWA